MRAWLSFTFFILGNAFVAAQTSTPVLAIARLKAPAYPPIALAAHVYGDVVLNITLLPDGETSTVTVINGPPMLQQAAVESARQSLFKPLSGHVEQAYELIYKFQAHQLDCGQSNASLPNVEIEANTVTISGQFVPLCDPAADITHIRSAKCLFLWRCGIR